jgi:predicted extracellular nuclease
MKFRLLPSLISAAVLMAPSLLSAATFTPGNLIIMRVGVGPAALTNAAVPTFLDEYTTAGGLVQSIALPTATGSGENACVLGGSASNEGYLTLSSDGQWLVGGCYSSALGTATPANVAPATAPRTVFRATTAGAVDTSTSISTTTASGAIRGVASDGNNIWFGTGGGGSFHTTLGATSATQLYTTLNNSRNVQIADGQLYGTTASGTALRLFTIGTGLPTTGGQTLTQLNGVPSSVISPAAFFFADLTPAVAGVDTVYLTDDSGGVNGGIRKYSLVAGTWTLNGTQINTNASNIRGLTGTVSAGVVTLYGSNNSVSLVSVVDNAGYNAAPSSGSATVVATSATGTAFRGVVFLPSGVAVPNLTIAPASGTEGDTPGCSTTQINFTVTSDTVAPVGGIAFTYSTADGSATLADSDYVQVTGGAGSIAAGLTTGTASVSVTCDKNAESNETFSVNLIDGATYNLGSPSTAAGTINDDDTPTLSVADVSLTEGNSGISNMTFTVQLDRPAPNGGVSYSYATADIDANAGSDYVATGTQGGGIMAGATSQQHTVTINGDTDAEANETFSFTVSAATPVAAAGNDFVATGTIQNDDVSALPTISINDVSIAEGDGGSSALTFNVTLSAAAPVGGVTFDIATADGTATDADNDYEPVSLTGQTILAGNNSYNLNVTINGDTAFEPNQNFAVNISNATNVAPVGNDTSGVGTINNDDAQPIALNISPVAVAEGHSTSSTTTMTFPVSLDAPAPAGGVTFFAATSDGTATTANSDYTPLLSTQFTIAAGQTTPIDPVTVSIRGDLINESDETLTVTISNATGTGVSINTAGATGVINNDDSAPLTIEAIQGNGHASPVATQVVTTLGNIVTAVLPAPNGGFMIQMPDAQASGDMATSNGLLVFTGATPSVAVGDAVDVRGTLVEFSTNMAAAANLRTTEFTNAGLVFNIVSNGNPLPAPVVLNAMVPSPNPATPHCGAGLGNFECMESMRVTTSTGMVNLGNQTFGTDPIAEMWVTTSGQRVFREGGILPGRETEIVPVLTPPAPPVPSTYVYDLNPEVFELDMDRAGLPNTILVPGTSFSATGVLTQEFGGFEMFPTQLTVNTAAPAIPLPVATATAAQLTLGSQNLHLLFDDVNDPWNAADCTAGDVDFCPTTVRWNAKLNLLSRQIREQLKSPMVVAVQEVEKLGALQAVAAKLNTDLGPTPPFTYTAHVGAIDNLDGGHQNVGFLIRSNVTIISLTQLNTTQMWTFNGSPQGEVMDRPPYLLRATVTLGGPDPFEFAVMVAHQRSLTGIDDLDPLADHIDAHRVRQKRLYQAALTAQAIQQFRAANPNLPFYLLGDFNAFPESDGYADVTGIIKGTTDPALSEYDLSYFNLEGSGPNGNIVNPPLTAGSELAPAGERYSYQFQNMPQQIDHAMMSAAGLDRFDDMQFARNNVDQQARFLINFSNSLGTETPLVSSDHDGFVLFIDARGDSIFGNGFEN